MFTWTEFADSEVSAPKWGFDLARIFGWLESLTHENVVSMQSAWIGFREMIA